MMHLWLTKIASRESGKLNDEDIERIQKTANQIYQFLQESRNDMEQLQIKDKALEKAFRKEYSEQSTAIQETMLKMYRWGTER